MSLEITIALLAAGLAISGAMIWLERRPRTNLDVRMIPTTPFLMVGVVMALVATIHLLGLLGRH
jgi:uncharacterized iron-regulated membrane protein